jgi:hypothetical protein
MSVFGEADRLPLPSTSFASDGTSELRCAASSTTTAREARDLVDLAATRDAVDEVLELQVTR